MFKKIILSIVFLVFANIFLSAQTAIMQLNNETFCGINFDLEMSDISLGTIVSRTWTVNGPAGFSTFTNTNVNTSVTLNQIGSYQVILEVCLSSGACDDTIMTVNVNVVTFPTAVITVNDTIVCYGGVVSFDGSSSLYSTTGVNYYWDNDYNTGIDEITSAFSFLANSDKVIMLVVEDDNNCVDTAFQNLHILHNEEPDFTINPQCVGVPFQLTGINLVSNSAPDSMFWYVDSSIFLIGNNISYSHATVDSIPIVLNIVNDLGCNGSILKYVKIDSTPLALLNINDTTICEGQQLDLIASGGTFYKWSTGETTNQISVSPTSNSEYTLSVSTSSTVCNEASTTIKIDVLNKPELSFDVTTFNPILGTPIEIDVSFSPQFSISDSLVWLSHSTSNVLEQEFGFENKFYANESVNFPIQLIYHKGLYSCKSDTNVSFLVDSDCSSKNIFIPNIFSPNLDGIHDVFEIAGFSIDIISEFKIYNRGGEEVMSLKDVKMQNGKSTLGWNGMNKKDVLCNAGVYIYTYSLKCINGGEHKGSGNISLIR